MTYSSGDSLMDIRFQNLTRVKAPAVIIAFLVLMIPRLWADSQKEYIYIGGEVVAVETPICTYGISPTSASPSAGGGISTGTVYVTATDGCAWTASSNALWITITSGTSGTGSGPVGYSVAANNTGSQRSGTLTIAGKTFTFTQSPCTYSISPTSASSAASGATGKLINVTAAAGCSWTASSGASWITITSGASGTGNGPVAYSVAANNTGSQRSGALTIGGKTFTVTQPPCSYGISPSASPADSGGGGKTVTVTATSGCPWTASSGASWITITSGASGTGSGPVGYSVAANNTGSQRIGTLTIAGKTFTVTQSECTYSISPTSITHVPQGGKGSVSITASSSNCAWTTTNNASSWVTITGSSSGTGSGTLNYTFSTNIYTQRSGTLIIAGKTFTITQSGGAACESQYLSCISPAANCSYDCGTAATNMGCYPEMPGCMEWYYNCIWECESEIYWGCDYVYNNGMSGY